MSGTCALYSFCGLLFCGWVALLLQTQPFYLTGIEDADLARKNALGAMGLFMVTMSYSLYKVQFPDEKPRSNEPQGPEGYQLNTGATEYGSY